MAFKIHARNLDQNTNNATRLLKEHTETASFVSSEHALVSQLTLASDQIDAQIPTATIKVRTHLPRGPLPLELSVSDIGTECTSRPAVSRETILAHPAPRLAYSLTCTVNDCTCQASGPFGIGCHTGVWRVPLGGDDKGLVEHRLNFRRIIGDLESRCVSHRYFAVVRRTAVREIYYERRAFAYTRRIASKERRPRTEVLCSEFPKRCWHKRERVR